METFKCDGCGKTKSGKKYPMYDENYNKQKGLFICQDCFTLPLTKKKKIKL